MQLIKNDLEWFKKPCIEIGGTVLMSKIEHELKQELSKHPNGVGLAANQIGYNFRMAVIKLNNNEILTLCNPIVVSRSKKTFCSTEGCLSFPGRSVKCRRHSSIVVKADKTAEAIEYIGRDAVVIQHEIAHLNGKTMFDYKYIKSNGKFTPKKKRRKNK